MTGAVAANSDPQEFLAGLAESVLRVLPDAVSTGVLTVDRERSLGDRLSGRPGVVSGLRLTAEGEALTLRLAAGPRWITEVARVSGGVIISRRTPPLGEWLTAFAGRIAAVAADAAGDAATSSRALHELGIQPAAADIRVDESTLAADLGALPARLTGRVPDDAISSVRTIGGLLIDTLARVGGDEETGSIVRRTATTYLPDTLRAYLSLPQDWAASHVFRDGSTAQGAFLAQLATLETAVVRMHDSAVAQDAVALLDNGRFLSARFARSSLDL